MAELERVYKLIGGQWTWVTEEANTGGGGSQDLAQVLAEGGDPEGNPITGATTISPGSLLSGESALKIQMPDDSVHHFPMALAVKNSGDDFVFLVDGRGVFQLTLDPEFNAQVSIYNPPGDEMFNIGPTGAVTISPTSDDLSAAPVQINMPDGASSAGQGAFRIRKENNDFLLNLDAYGQLTLFADTVDPSNGGGTLELFNSDAQLMHTLQANDGNGIAKVGLFGASPVAQPVVRLTSPTVQDVLDALVALGLVAQHD